MIKTYEERLETARAWKRRNKARVKVYRHQHWLDNKEHGMATRKSWYRRAPHLSRWHVIKARSRVAGIPLIISQKEFAAWYLAQEKQCHYCDLSDLSVDQSLSTKLKPIHFSIDRKNSRLPYTADNMCFCCWRCNRLKSDFFTHDEWVVIAKKYVKPRWEAELAARN